MVFSTKMKYVLSSIAQRIRRFFVFTVLLFGALSVFAQKPGSQLKLPPSKRLIPAILPGCLPVLHGS